jgi:hypothetical protein
MSPREAKPAPSKTHVAGSGTGVPTRSTEGAIASSEGGSPIRAIALPQKAPPPTDSTAANTALPPPLVQVAGSEDPVAVELMVSLMVTTSPWASVPRLTLSW